MTSFECEELVNAACLGQEAFETLAGAFMKLDLAVDRLIGPSNALRGT